MGFGLVFIGVAMLLFFRLIPVEVLGFAAAYRGLMKLAPYDVNFKYAGYSSALLCAFGAFDAVVFAGKFAGFFTLPEAAVKPLEYVHAALMCIFLAFLALALHAMGETCGYTKGKRRAVTLLSFTAVYAIGTAVSGFLPEKLYAYVAMPVMLLSVMVILLAAFTTYGFYMNIVTDSMLEKERIAIEAFDSRFKKNNKANKK